MMDQEHPQRVPEAEAAQAAVEILRCAFEPYGCMAEYRPESGKVLFAVADPVRNEVVIKGNPLDRHEFEDRTFLERLIWDLRQMGETHKGLAFHPWDAPFND